MTDKQFRFARTSQCYCLGQRENACSKANCTQYGPMVSTPWNDIWSYRPDTALQSPLEGPAEAAAVPLQSLLKLTATARRRQADDVAVIAAVAEIGDHDDVIARPTGSGGRPDPATLVNMIDVDVLPAQ